MDNQDLTEPLLLNTEKEADIEESTTTLTENESSDGNAKLPPPSTETSPPQGYSATTPFCIREEIKEMAYLAIPLAISFFCRMGMASTDSAFVGHIHDALHTPETYLAAAVVSDMILSICICPPLAFNQVLNALVGQAMGSGNPKMAGIWLQQSMFWLTVTMLPCLTGLFYVEPILLFMGFPANICTVAGTYARYNIVWPIPNGLYQCMRFYFQAQGMPLPATYNNIAFLFINGALNWLFVFGGPFRGWYWDGFGFIGAAISLSISRTMQGVVYYLYMFVYKQNHLATWPEEGWSMKHHTLARTLEFMKQSLPNVGTILFQSAISQATTVLVGRLGELPIAASSALSTVTIPWSGTLAATTSTVSAVRVGYHLGRGDAEGARQSAWLVLSVITVFTMLVSIVFLLLKRIFMEVATDDANVLGLATTLVPAMLVGTYLNLMVGNLTSGVFAGMGRPIVATVLSFGLELPLSIGGVALYILYFHGNLLGVYWWQAIAGGIELVIVLIIFLASDWNKCVEEARIRQESPAPEEGEQEGEERETLLEGGEVEGDLSEDSEVDGSIQNLPYSDLAADDSDGNLSFDKSEK